MIADDFIIIELLLSISRKLITKEEQLDFRFQSPLIILEHLLYLFVPLLEIFQRFLVHLIEGNPKHIRRIVIVIVARHVCS